MLGGMALKWRWRERMKAQGKPTDKPNLVMGMNVQVCWEKFCRYWEVEPRFVPMEGERFHLTAPEAVKLCDENTIGVIAILGSTFDGAYENVKEINDALEKLNAAKGWHIPIHVDAASGGFVAPFLQPELEWDFRVPLVASINTSGHKFGLVYPGIGWVIWRNKAGLPEDLVFHCNYLGGDLPNFALELFATRKPGHRAVLQFCAAGQGRLSANPPGQSRRGPVPVRRDRQDAGVPQADRRQHDSGVRVHNDRSGEIQRVRPVGQDPRTRLAGSRLYVPEESRGPGRLSRGLQGGFLARYG